MSVKDLIAQKARAKSIINFMVNTKQKRAASELTLSHFESRLDLLERYWTKFMDVHADLLFAEAELKPDEYFSYEYYVSVEDSYSSSRAELFDCISSLKSQTELAAPSPAAQHSPPQTHAEYSAPSPLALPSFDGKQEDWESFKQRFQAYLNSRPALSQISKLQHLLDAVKGSAAQRLKSIQLVGSNFSVAWERLMRRYDNPQRRLSSHLEALIQLSQVRPRNPQDLLILCDRAEVLVQALTDLDYPIAQSNHFVVHCIVRKMDMPTKEAWNISQEDNPNLQQYSDLAKFLERRAQSLEQTQSSSIPDANLKASHRPPANKPTRFVLSNAAVTHGPSPVTCSCCKQSHALYQCAKFKGMSPSDRLSHCRRNGHCLNCLGRNHRISNCPSEKRCYTCRGKHNTLLHLQTPDNSKVHTALPDTDIKSNAPDSDSSLACTAVLAHTSSSNEKTLLATANVIVSNGQGLSVTIRALIDPAAETSFISSRVASLLSLTQVPDSVSVIGVGGEKSGKTVSSVTCNLKSTRDPHFELPFSAFVINVVCRSLPSSTITAPAWPHLQNLPLADEKYFIPSRVDVLLGGKIYPRIIGEGLKKGPPGSPVAQSTIFGWIITGPSLIDTDIKRASIDVCHNQIVRSIDDTLQAFWKIEEVPSQKLLSIEDQECEEFFARTTTRLSDGRFVVRLPFATKLPLTNSKSVALNCLRRSIIRRSKNPLVDEAYKRFMVEYEKLGHMRRSSAVEQRNAQCYLPHHAVFRDDDTNKIRVVFNASQRFQDGRSLNDLLYPGPKLQADITAIVTNWRFYPFVFTSDIVKMFRQILVHPDDLSWQHLLWQEAHDSPVLDYIALTVTYGTASAPYLAIRTLLLLAEEGASKFPEAAAALRKETYVDDIFSGADSLPAAISRRDQLIQLLGSAGMSLGKWAANDERLLRGISPTTDDVPVELEETVSALGLRWRPATDTFHFSLRLSPRNGIVTKRIVLSETARLFDPLGWLAPVIIIPKLLMQDLWLQKIEWDDALPADLLERWQEFRSSLRDLGNISIPRYTGIQSKHNWTLHGFCDASKRAYAAVIYSTSNDGHTTLLIAKTKVAPLRVQSLPRLELCGALLLVRLAQHLQHHLFAQPTSLNFWTDSTVVLDWIKSHPSRWQTFVANRVSEIQSTFPNATWRHVVSKDNPADPASRGAYPAQLDPSSIWWSGPSWLSSFEKFNPVAPLATPHPSPEVLAHLLQEARPLRASSSSPDQPQNEIYEFLNRFSTINKMYRFLARCCRWRAIALRQETAGQYEGFSVAVWAAARRAFVYVIQSHHFSAERSSCRLHRVVKKTSPLIRLAPFLSDDDLLRVGGRLANAMIPYQEKHPVILPRCNLVRRLVEYAHLLTYHGGPQATKSYLSRFCWIVGGNRLMQSVFRNCAVCIRFSAHSVRQQMAPLPACRTTLTRPFDQVGIDFAGPFPLRFSKGRGAKSIKGYIAVFVCMAVKAVHIEVVSDLTTEAFLAAYSRFVARRGLCSIVFSDNGTNFKGAAAELAKLFDASSAEMKRIVGAVAEQGTQWSFIPPRAPHFGGLWEAAVRSFKTHYKRIIGETKLTYEEMATLAAKIEACMNSRPLCPLSSCGSDLSALTPGHFLIGKALLSFPEPGSTIDLTITPACRWQHLTQMRNSFWFRWRTEVLNQMQQRNLWLHPQRNLDVDDIVIVKDENTPPGRWPLARVTTVHPGPDGLVRVVTVRTATSQFKRSVTKLIHLPVDDSLQHYSPATKNEDTPPL